jgi:ankyrin repeat protein
MFVRDYGADVDARNVLGHTPLDSALRSGHRDVVELLLRQAKNRKASD